MIVPRFMNVLHNLKTLYNIQPVKLEHLIALLDEETIVTLAEIAKNILFGVVALSPQRFKKLKKYRTYIKLLAKKSISLRRKRQILKDHPEIVNQILFAKLFTRSSHVGKKTPNYKP